MTLSLGMSFGPGLYGHDIVRNSIFINTDDCSNVDFCSQGGFAGKMHPSPELLIRWCQNVSSYSVLTKQASDNVASLHLQGAWHSRFTVVSTD